MAWSWTSKKAQDGQLVINKIHNSKEGCMHRSKEIEPNVFGCLFLEPTVEPDKDNSVIKLVKVLSIN